MFGPGFIDPFHFWYGLGGAYPNVPTYSERGSERIAVDQPQGGGRYPFVDPDESTRRLLVDFYLAYEDELCQFTLPFHIDWLYGFGYASDGYSDDSDPVPVRGQEIVVRDAANRLVFDSTDAPDDTNHFFETDWGDLRRILEWRTSSAVCRLVYNIALLPGEEPLDLPINYSPESAVLDARTLEKMCPRVTALVIKDGDDYTELSGTAIILKNGYNTLLVPATADLTSGGRRTVGLELSADPGTGEGRFEADCDDSQDLHLLGGVEPTEGGDLLLQTSDCYRWEIPHEIIDGEAVLTPHTLQIKNDCQPCCSCEGYVTLWEAIRTAREVFADLAARIEATRDLYRENLQRWGSAGRTRQENPLRLSVQALDACLMGVVGSYCNNTGRYLAEVELRFTFTSPTVGAIRCNSTFRSGSLDAIEGRSAGRFNINSPQPYTMEGDWPEYSARFFGVPAGGAVAVTFQLEFDGCTVSDNVTVTLGAYDGGGNPLTYEADWPETTNPQPITPITVNTDLVDTDVCAEE